MANPRFLKTQCNCELMFVVIACLFVRYVSSNIGQLTSLFFNSILFL